VDEILVPRGPELTGAVAGERSISGCSPPSGSELHHSYVEKDPGYVEREGSHVEREGRYVEKGTGYVEE